MRISSSGLTPIFCECQRSYIVGAHEGDCNISYALHAAASIFTQKGKKKPALAQTRAGYCWVEARRLYLGNWLLVSELRQDRDCL